MTIGADPTPAPPAPASELAYAPRPPMRKRRAFRRVLIGIGLLKGNVDKIITDLAYRRFYMHRTSHWLGMDVHDVGSYYTERKPRPLAPGMVLTVEPGLYFTERDERVRQEFRGIGVRIEDDVLVTETGARVLSDAIPKHLDAVEQACAV